MCRSSTGADKDGHQGCVQGVSEDWVGLEDVLSLRGSAGVTIL